MRPGITQFYLNARRLADVSFVSLHVSDDKLPRNSGNASRLPPCECAEHFTEILPRWWQNDDDTFCKSNFKPHGSEPAAVHACLKAWCYSQCCRPCAVKCLILTLSLEQFLIWPAINFMEMTGAVATHHRAIGSAGPGSQTFPLWSPMFICI